MLTDKSILITGGSGSFGQAFVERILERYTLIETATLNGVDPQAWLTDTIGRISDYTITRLDGLMPWRYGLT